MSFRMLGLALLAIGAVANCASSGAEIDAGGGAGGETLTGLGAGAGRAEWGAWGNEDTAGGGAGGALTATGPTGGLGGGGGSDPKQVKCDGYAPFVKLEMRLPGSRSMTSPPLVRGALALGGVPAPGSVLSGEFLNHYDAGYALPASGREIAFEAGAVEGPLPNQMTLQIAVQAAKVASRPRTVGLVIDTSTSMAGESMSRARAAAAAILEGLADSDILVLVTPGGEPSVFHLGSARAPAAEAIAAIDADGAEDLGVAISAAYAGVRVERSTDGIGRVVFITDGAAPATSIDLGIVAGHWQEPGLGISLTGIGVGDALAYSPELVSYASTIGGGASVYLDSVDAATKLAARVPELLDIAARDVVVSVDLPDYLRVVSTTATAPGSSDAAGVPDSDLGSGRTMIFRVVVESCHPIKDLPTSGEYRIGATWRRADGTSDGDELETDRATLMAASGAQIRKASLFLAWGEAMANLRTAQVEGVAEESAAILADPALCPALGETLGCGDVEEIAKLATAYLKLVGAAP